MNFVQLARIATLAVSVTLVSAGHAVAQVKEKAAARAAGKISKIDAAAKTFVVTNKKKGDTTISFDDKTSFKKAAKDEGTTATAANATDLKDGSRVIVMGKMEAGKLVASSVVLGGHKKKAPK